MQDHSLLAHGRYSLDWVRPFYDQAGVWWGDDHDAADDQSRVAAIHRLVGHGPWRILDLGSAAGSTAAAMATAGHFVTGVEFSPMRARFAKGLTDQHYAGSLTIVEADFYTVMFDQRFDLVTYWDGFGVGNDADQRHLLRRMAAEWLEPGGYVLLDVFNPAAAARQAGYEIRLNPLRGVPGSVLMLRRWHFDAVNSRWIDEWVPVDNPDRALAQAIRCYSPADLRLLLEGTGLEARYLEVGGVPLTWTGDDITAGGPFLDQLMYLVQLQSVL